MSSQFLLVVNKQHILH